MLLLLESGGTDNLLLETDENLLTESSTSANVAVFMALYRRRRSV